MNKVKLGLFVMLTAVFFVGAPAFSEPVQLAPEFEFKSLAGDVISNESLAGKPALLVFWASWCGICQRELPKLKALYEENKAKGLAIVAIGVHDKQSNIINYVTSHSETFIFPVAFDSAKEAPDRFGIRGVPKFVLLDKDGAIVLTHTGGGFMQNPALIKFIEALK